MTSENSGFTWGDLQYDTFVSESLAGMWLQIALVVSGGCKNEKGVGWKGGVELQLLITNATDSGYSGERKSQGISLW